MGFSQVAFLFAVPFLFSVFSFRFLFSSSLSASKLKEPAGVVSFCGDGSVTTQYFRPTFSVKYPEGPPTVTKK